MRGRRKERTGMVILVSGLAAAMLLTGCETKNTEQTAESQGEHEPLTIVDSGQDYTELLSLVHEK